MTRQRRREMEKALHSGEDSQRVGINNKPYIKTVKKRLREEVIKQGQNN